MNGVAGIRAGWQVGPMVFDLRVHRDVAYLRGWWRDCPKENFGMYLRLTGRGRIAGGWGLVSWSLPGTWHMELRSEEALAALPALDRDAWECLREALRSLLLAGRTADLDADVEQALATCIREAHALVLGCTEPEARALALRYAGANRSTVYRAIISDTTGAMRRVAAEHPGLCLLLGQLTWFESHEAVVAWALEEVARGVPLSDLVHPVMCRSVFASRRALLHWREKSKALWWVLAEARLGVLEEHQPGFVWSRLDGWVDRVQKTTFDEEDYDVIGLTRIDLSVGRQ